MISSSDDTDSLFSTLNGDSIDSNATSGMTTGKTKTNINGRRTWSDIGQNSEEENENTGNVWL